MALMQILLNRPGTAPLSRQVFIKRIPRLKSGKLTAGGEQTGLTSGDPLNQGVLKALTSCSSTIQKLHNPSISRQKP